LKLPFYRKTGKFVKYSVSAIVWIFTTLAIFVISEAVVILHYNEVFDFVPLEGSM